MRRAAALLIGLALLAALAVPLLIGGRDALRTLAQFPTSSYLALIGIAIVGWAVYVGVIAGLLAVVYLRRKSTAPQPALQAAA